MLINNDKAISEIRTKVIQLESDLAHHQKEFTKHEQRDDKRFNGLSGKVDDLSENNTEQHESIRSVLIKLQLRLAWLWGVGFTLVSLAQLLSYLQSAK